MFKKVYFLIVMALALIVSCQQPFSAPVTGSVQFGTSGSDVSASIISESSRGLAIPGLTKVIVSIEKAAGGAQVTDLALSLYNFAGNVLSENLVLPVGDYKLTKFLLQDASGNTLYAAPLAGSAKAYLVTAPLPLAFTVSEDTTSTVNPQVITTASGTPGEFGYTGFDFTVIAVFDFLVQAQIPGAEGFMNTTANISVMNGATELYAGALTAGLNQITLNDGIENYSVTVSKSGYATFTETYTTAQMKAFLTLPLFITLLPDTNMAAITKVEVTFTSFSSGGGESSWYLDRVSAAGASEGRLASIYGSPYSLATATFNLSSPISAGENFAFAWSGDMNDRGAVVSCYDETGTLLKSLNITVFNEDVLRLSNYLTPDTYLQFSHTGIDILSATKTL